MTRALYSKSSEAFHIVLCEAENVTTLHIDHIMMLRSYYQPQHMSVVQSSISLTHVMLWMQASLLLLQEMRLLCETQNRNESVSSECLLYDSLFVLKIMWCQYRSQSWLLQEHQVRWCQTVSGVGLSLERFHIKSIKQLAWSLVHIAVHEETHVPHLRMIIILYWNIRKSAAELKRWLAEMWSPCGQESELRLTFTYYLVITYSFRLFIIYYLLKILKTSFYFSCGVLK